MSPEELVAALVQLVASPAGPANAELRARCAEALERRGSPEQAQAVLAALVNLTCHDPAGPLPCLCKRCLARAPLEAAAEGLVFRRTFAVSGSHVLHFWVPEDLAADRAEVRRAVGQAVRARLGRRRRVEAAS